jgi:hypothetical protein
VARADERAARGAGSVRPTPVGLHCISGRSQSHMSQIRAANFECVASE